MSDIFEGVKGLTACKNKARMEAFEALISAMSEIFGTERVSVIGNSEIAVGIGDTKDSDGFTREVCFTVKPVIKDWQNRKTATKTIKAFDRADEAEAFEISKSEAEKKAEERAKAKAEKKARDEKARAEKKAKAEKSEGEDPSGDCQIKALYKSKVYTKIEPKLYEPFRCYVQGKGQEDGTEIITAIGLEIDKAEIKKVMQDCPEFIKFI